MTENRNAPAGLTVIVALMTMLGPFSIDTYLPSFPAIEAEYDISRALLSQSLGFYLAAFAISTLFFGPLADRIGRRLVIFVSLILYAITSIGCALADNYSTFLLFRVLQGATAGGSLVAGRAMIRDVYSPKDAHHAMSRVMMLFAIAPVIAPVIGGALQSYFGWHSIFYFLAIYAGLVMLLVFVMIPETLPDSHRQSFHPVNVAKVYVNTLVHQRFLFLVFIIAFYFCGIFLYIAGAPTVIFDFLKLGTNDFIYLFGPMVAGFVSGSWISSQLAHRWPIENTIKLALSIMLLGATLNALQAGLLTTSLVTAIIPLILYASGIGIAMPAMTILALDCFPMNRGTAAAMQGSIQMLANAFIASIAVPMLTQQVSHLALGQLVFMISAVLLWWRLPALAMQEEKA